MRLVLLIIAALFSTTIAARAADCPLQRIAVIPFETDETGHIYLQVVIAGKNARLMLDTGAFWSGIDADWAKAAGLEIRRSSFGVQLVDAAGVRSDMYAKVPEFKVGPMVTQDIDFMLMKGGDDHIGVLGMNFFQFQDLEIDNKNHTISTFSQKHCRGGGVHWADEAVTLTILPAPRSPFPMPIVTADLEGETIRALLDTGATFSHMDIDRAKRRFKLTDAQLGKPVGTAITASGARVEQYMYKFKKLTISGIVFEDVTMLLGKFDNSEMLLGMNELRHLHLYIALKDELVHVTPADAQ